MAFQRGAPENGVLGSSCPGVVAVWAGAAKNAISPHLARARAGHKPAFPPFFPKGPDIPRPSLEILVHTHRPRGRLTLSPGTLNAINALFTARKGR